MIDYIMSLIPLLVALYHTGWYHTGISPFEYAFATLAYLSPSK